MFSESAYVRIALHDPVNGDQMGTKLTPKQVAKFEQRIEFRGDAECWMWTGRMNERGYGRPLIDGKLMRAHRIAYELAKGPIPDGLIVRHSCDNPSCCNPSHLLVGTQKDNTADAIARKRIVFGTRSSQAKLNDDAVRRIRTSGEPVAALARLYGVDRKTVRQAKQGTRWKHV